MRSMDRARRTPVDVPFLSFKPSKVGVWVHLPRVPLERRSGREGRPRSTSEGVSGGAWGCGSSWRWDVMDARMDDEPPHVAERRVKRALEDTRGRAHGDWKPTQQLGMGPVYRTCPPRPTTPTPPPQPVDDPSHRNDAFDPRGNEEETKDVVSLPSERTEGRKDETRHVHRGIYDATLEVIQRCAQKNLVPEDVAFQLERVLHAIQLVLRTSESPKQWKEAANQRNAKGMIQEAALQLREDQAVRKILAQAWEKTRTQGVRAASQSVTWNDIKEKTEDASNVPAVGALLAWVESMRKEEEEAEADLEEETAVAETQHQPTHHRTLENTLRDTLGRDLDVAEEELARALTMLWKTCRHKPIVQKAWAIVKEYARQAKQVQQDPTAESPPAELERQSGGGSIMPSPELGEETRELWAEVKPIAFNVLREILHTACVRAKGLRLPTIHGVTETAVGKVAFYLTRMSISELQQDLDSVKVERVEGKDDNHFQLVLGDVYVSIEGFRWQFQQLGVPWLDGKGEANVTVHKVEIRFFFSYAASSQGMEVTLEGAALNVPKVNLVLKEDAGPSWLYSFLTSVLNDKLRNVLQKELNEVICRLAVRLSDKIGLMTSGVLALHLSPAVLELAAAIDPTVFDNEPVIAANNGQVHLLTEGIPFLHFSAAKHSPKVVLFSSQSHIPNLYLQLANEYGKDLTFGFVSCIESNLRDYFQVKEAPQLVVFPQFGSCAPPSVYRGELTINPLRSFLAQFCFKPGGVVEVTPSSLPIFLQQPTHTTLLLYFSQSSSKETFSRLASIAQMFQSTFPPAIFGVVEEDHEEILEALGRERNTNGQFAFPAALVVPPPMVMATNGMGYTKVYREEMHWVDGTITPRVLADRVGMCTSEPKKAVVRLSPSNLSLFLCSKPYKAKVILIVEELVGPLWERYCEVWRKHGKVLCMGVLSFGDMGIAVRDMLGIQDVPVVAAYQTPGARKRFFSRTGSHLLEESDFSSQDFEKQLKRAPSEGSIDLPTGCIKLQVPPLPAGVPFSNYVLEKERLYGAALTPDTLHAFCMRSLKLQK